MNNQSNPPPSMESSTTMNQNDDCLQTRRMHSNERGTYEQAEYEALKKTLTDARIAKASEKAEE